MLAKLIDEFSAIFFLFFIYQVEPVAFQRIEVHDRTRI